MSGVGSTGRPCRLQKVRYKLRAEVYVPKEEVSSEYPREMECSLINFSIAQASLLGCLDKGDIWIIKAAAPSLYVGVEKSRQ